MDTRVDLAMKDSALKDGRTGEFVTDTSSQSPCLKKKFIVIIVITVVICLAIGAGVGGYFGSRKNNREFNQENGELLFLYYYCTLYTKSFEHSQI